MMFSVLACVICSYVLLHHLMGGVGGVPGAWAYVEGGMGRVSAAIATSAMAHGASVVTEAVSCTRVSM